MPVACRRLHLSSCGRNPIAAPCPPSRLNSSIGACSDRPFLVSLRAQPRMNTPRLAHLIVLAVAGSISALAAEEPLRHDLGTYTRKITTTRPKAQQYFNQGLALIHGFNHSAAIR